MGLLRRGAVGLLAVLAAASDSSSDFDFATLEVGADGSAQFAHADGGDARRSSAEYAPFSRAAAEFSQGGGAALPPGRIIQFPAGVTPRSFALFPSGVGESSRPSLLVVDATPHGDLNGGKPFAWLLHSKRPYPFAYVLDTEGELQRKIEFADRHVLPYGVAAAPDRRTGITFYTAIGTEARVEVWQPSLEEKLTFHDYSNKAALPVFDGDGLLWVPYTIVDRLNEEYDTIVALWVYRPDGSRWEVFPRRMLANVRFPHAVHLDNLGRVYLAGLTGQWPFEDWDYGIWKPREGLDLSLAQARIDVYTVTADPREPAYVSEQIGRWQEMNGGYGKKEQEGKPLPTPEQYGDIRPAAVLKLHRSYAFPFLCLQALFVLTGDGYALAACSGNSTLAVLRVGRPGTAFAEAVQGDHARTSGAGVGGRGSGEGILREATGPSHVTVDLDESDGPSAPPDARVVARLEAPFGVTSIGGLSMDPSGTAFTILDAELRRLVAAPWPLLTDGPAFVLPAKSLRAVKSLW